MKKAWILKLIFICSLVLLGERVSKNPAFQTSSHTFLHASDDHSDAIVAIELEDEVEDEVLSFFSLPTTFDWEANLLFFILFFMLMLRSQHVQSKIPSYLRFHNLRL